MGQPIVVYGATGHTARFVIAELVRHHLPVVLAGRNADRLAAVARELGLDEWRLATVNRRDLARAIDGAAAVINAAGPFADTALPLIEAATDAGVPYVDVAAEPDVVEAVYERFAAASPATAIVPAAGFYGGIGELAAAAALGDGDRADQVTLATWLSDWRPTAGTRATITSAHGRRRGRRLRFDGQRLQLSDHPAPESTWVFPDPVGAQPVATEFTTADAVTLTRHRRIGRLTQLMATPALADLGRPGEPVAVDELGRSSQRFLVHAVVEQNGRRRQLTVSGTDIYAVTGPLAVEITARLLADPGRTGVLPASRVADPRKLLAALEPVHLQVADL